MDFNEIRNFVSQKGFRTLTEIKAQYSGEDQEVLDSNLAYLVSKSGLKKIRYVNPIGIDVGEIYFIPV